MKEPDYAEEQRKRLTQMVTFKPTGEKREFTEEEKKKNDEDMERLLRESGVIKPDEDWVKVGMNGDVPVYETVKRGSNNGKK
ncbi:MAG: hypothetical protein LIO96_04480 [Lachnospiraceae bacterium]|nr:hypothetical protein [Lachnospiraceae bacterium]